jgi:hypothetical protein
MRTGTEADERADKRYRASSKGKTARAHQEVRYRERPNGKAVRNAAGKRYYERVKLEVFTHYCSGEPHCQCPGCRTVFLGFLQTDHILGNGCEHFNLKGKRMGGLLLWQWLKKNNYPPGFQILCANCNSPGGKGRKEQCPMSGQIH